MPKRTYSQIIFHVCRDKRLQTSQTHYTLILNKLNTNTKLPYNSIRFRIAPIIILVGVA